MDHGLLPTAQNHHDRFQESARGIEAESKFAIFGQFGLHYVFSCRKECVFGRDSVPEGRSVYPWTIIVIQKSGQRFRVLDARLGPLSISWTADRALAVDEWMRRRNDKHSGELVSVNVVLEPVHRPA